VLARVPAFSIQLRAASAFRSAAFLEVHSNGRLLDLRTVVRRAGGPRLQHVDPFAGLLFHLTLGYFDAHVDVAAVRERLRSLRANGSITLPADELALVEVPTDQREAYPLLEPVRRFRLGSTAR
jgi:hypothetical protein